METRVSSATKEVIISDKHPTVLIGERINPTGKKKLPAPLQGGDLELVCQEALSQVQAGADILDINVGAAGVDETVLLPQAVQAVMSTVDVPLCIDSSAPKAMDAAKCMMSYRHPLPCHHQSNHHLQQIRRLVPTISRSASP